MDSMEWGRMEETPIWLQCKEYPHFISQHGWVFSCFTMQECQGNVGGSWSDSW